MPMLQKRGQGGRASGPLETDVSFVKTPIEETYKEIINLTEDWTIEKEPDKPAAPTGLGLGGLFGAKPRSSAFQTMQEIDPRLLKLESRVEGQVTFELTQADRGGTSLSISFSPQSKSRIETLKAHLPLHEQGMKVCSSCERGLLNEFTHCPYCGQKQDDT
tara:strand:+ start:349 stop:831 length:483 start_codon:yes stop_codon:yes gene_type:complete